MHPNYPQSQVNFLEALSEAYKNVSSWDSRRQILSIMTGVATFKEIQRFIPGLTQYRFTTANLHRLQYGRAAPVQVNPVTRLRIERKQLDHFLAFITSPHIVQDLPFGEKKTKAFLWWNSCCTQRNKNNYPTAHCWTVQAVLCRDKLQTIQWKYHDTHSVGVQCLLAQIPARPWLFCSWRRKGIWRLIRSSGKDVGPWCFWRWGCKSTRILEGWKTVLERRL